MKRIDTIQILLLLFLFLGIATNNVIYSQKIDVDNLLKEALNDANKDQNYELALKKSHLGIKLAPNYLDFYLLTGRIYQLTKQRDSARYYYNYVIEKNPVYEEAFSYLINMDLEEKKYSEAEIAVDKAIVAHPENKSFQYKKLAIYELQNDTKKESQYLKTLQLKYPEDNEIKQRIYILESKINSDIIGINYSFTSFDRTDYGPWHLGNLQYIRQRDWGSLIGRINYGNHFAFSESISHGIQFEAESYFFTGKKSYSFINTGFSQDPIFPKFRISYSYFQNFNKGWEADLGFRYIKVENTDFSTVVVGFGKYIGSYWLNLRLFFQNDNKNFPPAFTFTTRYYLDTKYDYFSFIAGYGTSPDEATTVGQYEQRYTLNSYRIGAGYNRIFNNHYVTGLLVTYNNQEYAQNLIQNEFEFSLMFQYKF